jgi:hypothetical protein
VGGNSRETGKIYLFFNHSSAQALNERFELFETSAYVSVAPPKFVGWGSLMNGVFELGHSNAE